MPAAPPTPSPNGPWRPGTAASRPPPATSLVGRDEELDRFLGVLARAGGGRPAVAVVAGEAGVGKTRFLAECATVAAGTGWRSLLGTCMRSERGVPYSPIAEAVRTLVRTGGAGGDAVPAGRERDRLAALLADLSLADPTVADPSLAEPPSGAYGPPAACGRTALFDGVLSVLTRLAADGPLVLGVDDLHWADEPTRDLLAFLVANLSHEPVTIVLTYRDEGVARDPALRAFLADVGSGAGIERIPLPRLSRADLAAHLRALAGSAVDPDVVDAVWARSEGNPFFAEELLATATRGEGELPATVADIVATRLAALSEPCRDLLRTAAAAGRRVSHDLLVAVARADSAAVCEALREAVAHDVLVAEPAGSSYAFRHVLIRDVAYDELLPGERTELHRAFARRLVEGPGLCPDPASLDDDLARHWDLAREPAMALAAAVAAGRSADASRRFADARRHYERVADLWPQVDEADAVAGTTLPDVLGAAASAADRAGDHSGAADLARRAIAAGDATGEPSAVSTLADRLAGYLWRAGCGRASLAAHDDAVRLVPDATPARAAAAAGRAVALALVARYGEARTEGEAAAALAGRVDTPAAGHRAGIAVGVAVGVLDDPATGAALLSDAIRAAEADGDADTALLGHLHLARLLAGPLDRPDQAAAVALDGARRAAGLGLERQACSQLEAVAARALWQLGRWDDADQVLERAAQHGTRGAAAADVALAGALVAVRRGRFADAERGLEAARALTASSIDPRQHAEICVVTAELAVWQSRPVDARRAVGEGLGCATALRDPSLAAHLVWLGLRAEGDSAQAACRRRTDRDGHAPSAAPLTTRLSALRPPAAAATTAVCEAEATRIGRSSDPARWDAAARTADDTGRPFLAAYARWRQAEALLARRTVSADAGRALADAAARAAELGADPLRREIADLAGRARIRLDGRRRDADRPPVASPAADLGLTPRECQVLALVARGRTNREIAAALFISEKTASVHVSNILGKLGVSTRVDAAGIARRLGVGHDHAAPSSEEGTALV